jgi:proline dehydrogenase
VVRSFFLFLSRLKWLRGWMETSSLAQRLSTRFVAGETLDQALSVARKLNAEGITVTLDHLGESVSTLVEAAEARDVYLRTLDAIHSNGIRGGVSLKLTQFGLDLSYEQCLANVEQLVRRAAELGNFVRVDMESSDYTDRTLALVHSLHARYGAVGVVIQSYLHRSESDVEKLCAAKIGVRLCKGAYLEPDTVAFARKSDVDRNYLELTRYLLLKGVHPGLATHDEAVIRQTCRFVTERKIPRESFEFQMLYGIRRDLQRRLVAEGYGMRLYVPFGKAWYPYYMRRLAERPANVFFMLRNLFRS